MKTVKEIRDEIEKKADLKKMNIVNDILSAIESNIQQSIQVGQFAFRIDESYNKEYVYNYDKIKPILESAGYKVERKEIETIVSETIFGKPIKALHKYIYISWE